MKSFNTKKETQEEINTNHKRFPFSPCFISDRYAKAHGVENGGWYIMSNVTKNLV
jgi:hypothetical protein